MATGGIEKLVKVVADSDLGYSLINKSDFDSNVHELFDGDVKEEPEPVPVGPTVESLFGKTQAKTLAGRGWDTLEEIADAEVGDLVGSGMEFSAALRLISDSRKGLES